MGKGQFDMNDLRTQLKQMQNMGGIGALAGMLPGLKKAQAAMANSGVNDKTLLHMDAIIGSMTKKERRNPGLLNGSRRARIARGSGTTPADVNRLLKQYQQMESMMSKLSRGGMKGMMRGMKGMLGGGFPGGFGPR